MVYLEKQNCFAGQLIRGAKWGYLITVTNIPFYWYPHRKSNASTTVFERVLVSPKLAGDYIVPQNLRSFSRFFATVSVNAGMLVSLFRDHDMALRYLLKE